MALVVQPSRNPMLNAAWKAHKAAQRAEKKAKPADAEEIAPSHATRGKRPSTSAKPTKPAAKKPANARRK